MGSGSQARSGRSGHGEETAMRYRVLLGVGEGQRGAGRDWMTFKELDHLKTLSNCEMLPLDERIG